MERDHPEEALRKFEEALAGLESSQIHSYEIPELHLRRAEAFNAMARFIEAREACDTALDLMSKLGACLETGHVYRQRALALQSMGRPDEAFDNLSKAEDEIRRVGDKYELTLLLLDRAELFGKDAERAVRDADEAVTLAEQVGIDHLQQRARDIADICLARMLKQRRAERAAHSFKSERPDIVAESPAIQHALSLAAIYGKHEMPVLVTGETGVGKELIAQTIHASSRIASRRMVAINCAAIPESIMDRELFGHVRGAFTGADRDQPGLVAEANGSTLFLDEIGELPAQLQAKLLRFLQEGTYRPVGSTKELHAEVRIVAATHRDLLKSMQRGEFREDLYYRVASLAIDVPPLRERIPDLIGITNQILEEESLKQDIDFWMEKESWQLLKGYPWPGNIRQLISVVRAACLHAAPRGLVQAEHLRPLLRQDLATPVVQSKSKSLVRQLQDYERKLITEALEATGFNRMEAAKRLGIGRNTIYDKMERLGMEAQEPHGLRPAKPKSGTRKSKRGRA